MKLAEKIFTIPNKHYATSKFDQEISTECPRTNDKQIDVAINDIQGHNRVICCIVSGIRACGDRLLGTLHA